MPPGEVGITDGSCGGGGVEEAVVDAVVAAVAIVLSAVSESVPVCIEVRPTRNDSCAFSEKRSLASKESDGRGAKLVLM